MLEKAVFNRVVLLTMERTYLFSLGRVGGIAIWALTLPFLLRIWFLGMRIAVCRVRLKLRCN
jgi:hypothetical protein